MAMVNRWAPWWLSVQDIGGGHIGYMNTEEFEALPADLQPLVRRKRSFDRKFGDVECWWLSESFAFRPVPGGGGHRAGADGRAREGSGGPCGLGLRPAGGGPGERLHPELPRARAAAGADQVVATEALLGAEAAVDAA